MNRINVIISSILFVGVNILTGCGRAINDTDQRNSFQTKTNSKIQGEKTVDIFDDPNKLVSILSQNGIGELKKWSNPMDLGWGSLTDYYPFGPSKNGFGMQNNISYYIEGTENKATKLYLNLNLNNPADKKNALKFLNDISVKTFRALKITMPEELTNAIVHSKQYKTKVEGYEISNELEKSKIETWKVIVERK